ncbi:hypothetical protein K402DRAFT_265617 [Aulographum hederae CBS 113979]|uniref:Uncharacterized protein n=1 Tax=Aulographum hederae CBS 113979 TaxID=1176131 RepID=A0A6G1GJ99_9PEZI|nr:hypothetical protein K402DRAFT_265617 [Aulographum hederae CBS 113979]
MVPSRKRTWNGASHFADGLLRVEQSRSDKLNSHRKTAQIFSPSSSRSCCSRFLFLPVGRFPLMSALRFERQKREKRAVARRTATPSIADTIAGDQCQISALSKQQFEFRWAAGSGRSLTSRFSINAESIFWQSRLPFSAVLLIDSECRIQSHVGQICAVTFDPRNDKPSIRALIAYLRHNNNILRSLACRPLKRLSDKSSQTHYHRRNPCDRGRAKDFS